MRNWRPQPEPEEYEPRHAIYELVDPDTKKSRYVGQCVDPQGRYQSHLKSSHYPQVERWVFELRKLRKKPELRILEHCRTFLDADEAERRWIKQRLNERHPLFNEAPGGSGGAFAKIATSTPTEWVHAAYCLKYARDALQAAYVVTSRSLPKRHHLPKSIGAHADKVQKILRELECVLEAEMPGWTEPWRVATGSASDHFEKIERIAPGQTLSPLAEVSGPEGKIEIRPARIANPSLAPDGGPSR